ncbi:MAG: LolA family protein [Planctomycetota bacterium]|jgi:hypothetical protein
MNKYILLLAFLIFMTPSTLAGKSCCAKSKDQDTKPAKTPEKASEKSDELQTILSKMKNATEKLKSCQTKLSYLLIQDPELLASETLKNGILYYVKDEDRSRLRIRFDDIKQDDFEPVKQRLEYLFDGVWLTRIDYKLKQIDQYQKAPEESPIDVFELISHNFPLVGFSGIDELEKDFEISLVKQKSADPNTSTHLLLKTRKDSNFNEEFTKIDFWVNNGTFLPLRIKAYSTQGDIHDIRFLDEKINKNLKNSVFTVETPAGFSKNREALKTEPVPKGS